MTAPGPDPKEVRPGNTVAGPDDQSGRTARVASR
jgi:hypothetical protein